METELQSSTDYYPFGQPMPERTFSEEDYRFGFNGQEKDNEITGVDGTHEEFKFREYDSRIGRFWKVDPLAKQYPWNSPYAFAENDVIRCIDLEGKEKLHVNNNLYSTGVTLLQIYATNKGKSMLDRLTAGNPSMSLMWTFEMSYSFFSAGSYEPASNSITWSNWTLAGPIMNPASYETYMMMGHEIGHANNEFSGLVPTNYSPGDIHTDNNRKRDEIEACRFGNYLLDVYGVENKRQYYDDVKIPQGGINTENEKIRNFSITSNNIFTDYGIIGASYEKSTNNKDFSKKFSIMWYDSDNNAQFKEFDSKKAAVNYVKDNFSGK